MSVRTYVVVPPMRGGLENLREMASNLWFSWNGEAMELFEHLDEKLWEEGCHNPQKILISLSKQRLQEIREDAGYRSFALKVRQRFKAYMERKRFYEYNLDEPVDFTVAYFSLEFGLTECLPMYSGGLGVLAGDHLKSASDLNLPLVAVGLMYHNGYFHQKLKPDGWQEELYPRLELDTLPLEKETDESGNPLKIAVEMANETLWARILKVNVGRVPLYLLDADIPDNPPHLRAVTSKLYDGDGEMRIRQEILLGVGGCRALAALGIKPTVFHLNEGHASFALLERIRHFIEDEGLSRREAGEMATAQSVITLHTAEPSASDLFDRSLLEKYFSSQAQRLGMSIEPLVRFGRRRPEDQSEKFSMIVLGLRLSSRANGVSRLHAKVARNTWREVWPNADLEDVPIFGLTNGVHIPSYISRDLAKLYDRYLGLGWNEDPDNEKIWQRADKIPDIELWRTHDRCRSRLVQFARQRLLRQLKDRGESARIVEQAERVLDPEALTICFTRRFGLYERVDLLFREPETLARIIGHSDRPVQIIMAGKAHPDDLKAKDLIKRIINLIKEEPFRTRMVFIEDYDINVARLMMQGADVWLNTPRRPWEACGTSGMKAAANGALNLSILDGWWDEGYTGDNGWAIGWREEYDNPAYQDAIESRALYNLLQESVMPLFYERTIDELPRDWIAMMKRSIGTLCAMFNSHRMVSDYVERIYVPCARNSFKLQADGYAALKQMVSWGKSIQEDWDKIAIVSMEVEDQNRAVRGQEIQAKVTINTAGHRPEELRVEILHGPMDLRDNFKHRHVALLAPVKEGADADGQVTFVGSIPLTHTGMCGYAARVTPEHPNLAPSKRFELVLRG
ncbi:MAG: alpha-glucan family phosphorylase [Thermodesulfobacteriota bacterium]